MEQSLWWSSDGIGDGPTEGYAQDAVTEHWRMLWCQDPMTQGMALNYLGELLVTNPEWQTLEVASGGGICYGFGYRNTGIIDLILPIPSLGTTGWRVVLRTDWAERTVRLVLLQSADGGAGYPGVTQNAGYRWEISLAHGVITVGGAVTIVADDRAFLGSSAQIDHNDISNRTRWGMVQATVGYNTSDLTEIQRHNTDGIIFPDNKYCSAQGSFVVPIDYLSDLVVKAVVDPWASGDMRVIHDIEYSGCGELPALHTEASGIVEIGVTIDIRNCISALTLGNAAPQDMVDLIFARGATSVLDTIGDSVWFKGWIYSYLADS